MTLSDVTDRLGGLRQGICAVHDRAPPMFALRDLRKDLGFALALFDKSSASMPLTRSSSELVTAAASESPDDDISLVVRSYWEAAPSAGADTPAAPLAAAAR